jgi:hypothetical protein
MAIDVSSVLFVVLPGEAVLPACYEATVARVILANSFF